MKIPIGLKNESSHDPEIWFVSPLVLETYWRERMKSLGIPGED
jgi:hypothetical protein